MTAEYSERFAAPEEADRGKVLDALADGSYWAFVKMDIDSDGDLSLKIEADDRLDGESIKALLRRTVEAMP